MCEIVSTLPVKGLVPVISCPRSVWYSVSPGMPLAVFLRSRITACCTPRSVICATITNTFGLGEFSET